MRFAIDVVGAIRETTLIINIIPAVCLPLIINIANTNNSIKRYQNKQLDIRFIPRHYNSHEI